MNKTTMLQDCWKIALRAALVVGGVYTIFMIIRHYMTANTVIADLLYIGGISFIICTVPVFLIAWVLLSLFGPKLLSTSTD